jgi:hypothetical protein
MRERLLKLAPQLAQEIIHDLGRIPRKKPVFSKKTGFRERI